jgi:hypothetical protein
MANWDLTRFLDQPKKHYVGARMQQGRLLVDSDFGEGALLQEEDRQRAARDLLGPKASPDEGFSLGRPLPPLPSTWPQQTDRLQVGDTLTTELLKLNGTATAVRPVSVRAGSMYVGGLRFDLEQAEHIALQRDFLQMRPQDVPAPDPAHPGRFRALYVLHAWEQGVTQLEDEETLENALGGTDTSVRIRRMRRVEIFGGLDDTTTTCDAAWARFIAQFPFLNASLDPETNQLVSNGLLQLTFAEDGEGSDCLACIPDASSRFLGAKNETLRIMLSRPDRFVWAFDNATPLFRVSVTGLSDPNAEVRVEMLTPPSDETEWPLTNRVVEIIPFAAALDGAAPPGFEHPHFKKVAERVGAFARVTKPFDPNTRSFTLEPGDGVEAMREFVHDWDTRHPAYKELHFDPREGTDERFFFMRMWHEAPTAAEIELPAFDDPNPPALRGTDVIPHFRRQGKPGDFWIAALRPETPERVVPYDLGVRAVPPHGPRDFYAPLALLLGEGDIVTTVVDCRPIITRATDLGCVTFTVGDGVVSVGDFTSIQDAVDALPDAGGHIAVRQGVFRGRVSIVGRQGVQIEGCGDASILETPLPSGESPPAEPTALVDIANSHDVTLTSLRLRCVEERAVAVRGDTHDIELAALACVAGVRVGSDFVPGAEDTSIPVIGVQSTSDTVALRSLIVEPNGRGAIDLSSADRVTIEGVTISGVASGAFSPVAPLIKMEGCDVVSVRDSVLSAFGQIGVQVLGGQTRDVELSGLSIVCGRHVAFSGAISQSRSAVDIDGAERVRLEKSWVTMDESVSDHAGVVAGGLTLRIVGNHIETLSHCFDSPPPPSLEQCADLRVQAWGGLQIRGASTDVEVRENQILGGVGHGITLGSVIWRAGSVTSREGAGRGQITTRSDGHLAATGDIRATFGSRRLRFRAEDEGALVNVVIVENRIEQMAGNGISVLSVLGMPGGDPLVDVTGLRIESNTILDNVRKPAETNALRSDLFPFSDSLASTTVSIPLLPLGGIVLGTVVQGDVRGNVIVGNGSSPVLPTNGIFILNGDSIRITDNRISGNGGRGFLDSPTSPTPAPLPGVRAGIAVMLAGTGSRATLSDIDQQLENPAAQEPDDDGSSIRIAGNTVRHPEGRALFLVAAGPVAIVGNFFSSDGNHGSDTLNDSLAVGDVVYVQDIGAPWEIDDIHSVNFSPFETPSLAKEYLTTSPSFRTFIGTGGSILFAHNQVTLDWEVLRVPKVGVEPPISFFPVALLTLDHLKILDNQFALRLRGPGINASPPHTNPPVAGFTEPVLSNVFGLGATLVATGNRVSESVRDSILSLLTLSELMSSVTFNQSTHEIMTFNRSTIESPPHPPHTDDFSAYDLRQGNQVLFSATRFSPAADGASEQVQTLENFALQFLTLIGRPET